VLARQDVLGLLQREAGCGHLLGAEVLQAGQPGVDAGASLGLAFALGAQQLLGLNLQLTEIGTGG
jgi:hypothetical protein